MVRDSVAESVVPGMCRAERREFEPRPLLDTFHQFAFLFYLSPQLTMKHSFNSILDVRQLNSTS